jgi:hypothetical protein
MHMANGVVVQVDYSGTDPLDGGLYFGRAVRLVSKANGDANYPNRCIILATANNLTLPGEQFSRHPSEQAAESCLKLGIK